MLQKPYGESAMKKTKKQVVYAFPRTERVFGDGT
jgi:hypothetical protein